jgi:hypothetical protein
MKCEPEDILNAQKSKDMTRFLSYIRNYEPPLSYLDVPLGMMESRERLTQEEYKKIRNKIRMKYCEPNQELTPVVKPMEVEIEGVSKHEMV